MFQGDADVTKRGSSKQMDMNPHLKESSSSSEDLEVAFGGKEQTTHSGDTNNKAVHRNLGKEVLEDDKGGVSKAGEGTTVSTRL